MDLGELVPAMREALRRGALLDPAAVKELGLDLSEMRHLRFQPNPATAPWPLRTQENGVANVSANQRAGIFDDCRTDPKDRF
jgi:hypothetical protein